MLKVSIQTPSINILNKIFKKIINNLLDLENIIVYNKENIVDNVKDKKDVINRILNNKEYNKDFIKIIDIIDTANYSSKSI